MIETGKLYYLTKSVYSSYAMNDTYDIGKRKLTEWVPSSKLEQPFLIVDQHRQRGVDQRDHYWIKVVIEDRSGWIHIDEDGMLREYKTYR